MARPVTKKTDSDTETRINSGWQPIACEPAGRWQPMTCTMRVIVPLPSHSDAACGAIVPGNVTGRDGKGTPAARIEESDENLEKNKEGLGGARSNYV